jgi:CubicO group peptidase (beta-lactamase class C family)
VLTMRVAAGAVTFMLWLTPSLLSEQAAVVRDSVTPVPRFENLARSEKLATALTRIPATMPGLRAQIDSPGVAWGVIVDGQLAASGGNGARVVAGDLPVSAETIFRIASMTKSFTALAIVQLRDAGRLSLDDPASKYLPELRASPLPTTDSPVITIRQLLTHGAGLPEDNPWGDRQLAIANSTLDMWLRKGLPFSTPPATTFEYSNYGFALLGRIVTRVSGVPYHDYVDSRILQPLGMTSTFWDPAAVPPERMAHGYKRVGQSWVEERPLAHGAFASIGGLYTSVRDLSRFVAFMLSAWPPRNERDPGPVRRSSLREMQLASRSWLMFTRRPPAGPLRSTVLSYGYGLMTVQDCRFPIVVMHSGGLPGFGSHMLWLPEHGVGVIVLANATYAYANAISQSMVDALLESGGLQPRRTPPSRYLRETGAALASLVEEWSDVTLKSLAADNLFLDEPLDARRAQVAEMRRRLGTCTADDRIEAENWLRGSFRMTCQHGWLGVSFTLAPTQPPRVQSLTFTEARSLSPALKETVARIAAAIGNPQATLPPANASASADLSPRIKAIGEQYGACTPAETLDGDGLTRTRVRLVCARGPTELDLTAAADGTVERVVFFPGPGERCMP